MKITFDVSIEELTELIDAILDKDFECDCYDPCCDCDRQCEETGECTYYDTTDDKEESNCAPCCDCDRKCEETEECTYYDTNLTKNDCEKCGKKVNVIDAELLPFKGQLFIICSDCADKIEKFIKEREK